MIFQRQYFQHPSTFMICGPTGCGKSQFLAQLLITIRSQFNPVPRVINYFYSEYQTLFDELKVIVPFINFHEGLPTENSFEVRDQLIILDDLMNESKDNTNILDVFTKKSHHRNISIILIVQNLFAKGSCIRSMSLNSHYLVLFNNPRDRSQIKHLARQMNPSNPKFIEEAFEDATNARAHGYLVFDLRQQTPEILRLKSNIFEESGEPMIIYTKRI